MNDLSKKGFRMFFQSLSNIFGWILFHVIFLCIPMSLIFKITLWESMSRVAEFTFKLLAFLVWGIVNFIFYAFGVLF